MPHPHFAYGGERILEIGIYLNVAGEKAAPRAVGLHDPLGFLTHEFVEARVILQIHRPPCDPLTWEVNSSVRLDPRRYEREAAVFREIANRTQVT